MSSFGLAVEPSFFHWWAVSEAFIHPRWRHLWRGLVVGLPPVGRGNEWPDCSAYGNHGHIEGCPFPGAWSEGLRAWALDLDGVDGRVRVYDHQSLDLTEAITIEALIYPRETNDVVIAAKRDAANYAWQLRITADPNNRLEFSINAAANAATSASAIPENEWTRVMGTYDREAIRVFINGEEDGSQVYTTAISTNDVDVTIGSNLTAAPGWFDGLAGTARIWDLPLSSLESKELRDFPYGMYQLYIMLDYLVNHYGKLVLPQQPNFAPAIDDGPVTNHTPTGYDRSPAKLVLPQQPNFAPAVDDGPVTKHTPTGYVRGNPLFPYNPHGRGLDKRDDKKLKKYWNI